MSGEKSRVWASVDLAAEGKQRGFLTVPHSRNDSAWGSIRIPITVIANGEGPTVLMTAGSHGDEYEGPIALMKLGDWLEPEMVRGRVILLPTMNHPAVCRATRLSPIDGLNMNRTFPGRYAGTATEVIAHYVYHHLVPLADVVVDLHSGGKTLDFVPSVVMHRLDDPELMTRTLAAIKAFGAPVALVLVELDNEGMLDTEVENLGKMFISTELGGAGTSTTRTIAVAEAGVRNLLCHFGMIEGRPTAPEGPSRLMHTPDGNSFVISADAGMYEILADVGSEVKAGDPIGRVHFFEDHGRQPSLYTAPIDGLVYARHVPGLIQRGDCLAVIATDYSM
ncbi:MAG TPA: N(2)-acetyl-L-2,4-diaminobutanoate deacetylase DoeB [Alphaproteobacteria bacterium]|nr:N(2)-acetyl-L-2,4-diaminobutanoate deacetylase DoeB [Alphaproteobacteria bacterium]